MVGDANSPGKNASQLYVPWDLALDWQENLYVTDRSNYRVQKFARGSKIGITVAGNYNGTPGNDLSSLSQCTGIIVDDNGNVYVSDYPNDRVMLWKQGQTSGVVVAGKGRK